MFHNFSEEARKIMALAKEEMCELKHPYVGSEHLLLALLKKKTSISNKLKEHKLLYSEFKKEIINIIGYGKEESEWFLYTPVLKNILENSVNISKDSGVDVSSEILFMGFLEEGEGIAIRLLINMGVDIDKIYQDFIIKPSKRTKKRKLLVEDVGIDLTDKSKKEGFDPVVGRDLEIKRIMEILTRRNKNNPLLIGDAGVGKTALIEELSRKIIVGEVPSRLLGRRIISIDMSSLVAGTKYRGEFEEKINKMIKELEDHEEIILFIDEIHTLIGAGGAEGAIDAANILKPALARNKLHLIGATTTSEYKKYMESDKALDRRFQTVLIKEPDDESVREIIYKLKPIYEKYHKVLISNDIIDLLIKITKKYIHNRKDPDKTIDILDEVCSHANLKENKKLKKYHDLSKKLTIIMNNKKKAIINNEFSVAVELKQKENTIMNEVNKLEMDLANIKYNNVTKKDLEDVVKMKIEVPIYELNSSLNIDNLINKLKRKIIGQNNAIEELVNTYSNNIIDNRCFGVMFSGTSGVGKTCLALEFGRNISNNIIRLDMSEYSESHSVSKLIGAPAGYIGYNDTTNIFEEVRTFPFSVLILDEIERAHPKVINLFLQILDNSMVKDSKGNTVYFNNAIIIMTTNICEGKVVGFNKTGFNKELNEYFGIPFINRIDKVIHFNKLNRRDIEEIISNKIRKTDKYKKWRITKSLRNEIIEKSNYVEYGARQIPAILKGLYQYNQVKNI
jgi:ATPases with chaperone activity, ATP-binding subunit